MSAEMRTDGNSVSCGWESETVQPLGRTARSFLHKLKTLLPEDPAAPLPGVTPPNRKQDLKGLFADSSQAQRAVNTPADEWMNKTRSLQPRQVFQPQEGRQSCRCDDADGPGGHSAE